MERWLVAAALGILLAACSSGAGNSKVRPTEPTTITSANSSTTRPASYTFEKLDSAVLGLASLPAGFASRTYPSFDPNKASESEGLCNGANALARAQAAGSVAHDSEVYGFDPKRGPFVHAAVYGFSDVASARAFMASNQSSATACTSWTYPAPEGQAGPITATVAPVRFPNFGDTTLAYKVVQKQPEDGSDVQVGTIGTAFIRKSNAVAQVEFIWGGLFYPSMLRPYAKDQASALERLRR